MNVQGWRQFDYLRECHDRFKARTRRWMGLQEHDNSWLTPELRSLDQMAYSSQYFFMVAFHAAGMMTCSYGMSMVLKAGALEYSVMQDPIAIPLMIMTSIGCRIMKKAFISCANACKLASDILCICDFFNYLVLYFSCLKNSQTQTQFH
jgi:hypothetical protein